MFFDCSKLCIMCLAEPVLIYFCPFISDQSDVASIMEDLAGLEINDKVEQDEGI